MQQFIPQNQNFKAMVEEKMELNHFMNYLGFKITKIEAGNIEGSLKIEPQHRQQIGFIHGGVIATLADLVAGFAAYTLVGNKQTVVTAELKISYLNPGVGDTAFCRGFVLKAGQKLIFSEAEIFANNDNKEVLIAKASGTFAVIDVPA